ncbi:MAG: VWA domain-containing protein [Chthoniobacterales bacterium]
MASRLADFVSRIRRRVPIRGFLGISLAVHLLFALGAGVWVVSRYSANRKLTFNAGPKSPNPSERALQHKVQMQQKTQNTLVAVPKRVLTTGLSKVALPEMPSMAGPKLAAQPMMAAGGGGGFGGAPGGMGAAGGTGGGAPINFFGIRDTSSSVVIMIDISGSMFSRTGDAEGSGSMKLVRLGKEQSFQAVRDEAIKMVEGLTPAIQFGIIRWSGGAYSWKPELVPGTEENKQAAVQHIQTEIDFGKAKPKGRPGGTRHDYALEEAFKLKPQTIFMLTDGNATEAVPGGGLKPIDEGVIWRAAEEGQKELSKKAKLHTIYYLTGKDNPDEEHMLRQLASRNGGTFRKVKPPQVKTPPPTATTTAGGSPPPAQKPPDRKDNKKDERKKKKRR